MSARNRFKLDKGLLPEDLRYSRERFWALELPDGTVRLGLAVAAIQDQPPGVYFFHSRASGYIVTGKKFGFIDIDTGRFDMIAPLSGRIARVNEALASDPALLARDPYGEGWICEVTRVLPGALGLLLDRDSFHAWLRFEREARALGLDPTVGCAQEIVEGEPWPVEIVFRLGGRVVLSSRPVREGRNETFTPQWRLGQQWRVLCEFEQPSMAKVPDPKPVRVRRTWEYEVADERGEVDGVECWVLKVTEVEGPAPQKVHLLHIARHDFSLRLIEEVSVHDPDLKVRVPNDWGAESYIELRRPLELIVDLPLFPPENADERRVVRVGEEPECTVEARFPSPKRMELAVQAGLRPEAPPIRSEQVWELGRPWWTSARRLAGENVLITGKLIEN